MTIVSRLLEESTTLVAELSDSEAPAAKKAILWIQDACKQLRRQLPSPYLTNGRDVDDGQSDIQSGQEGCDQ